MFSSNNQVVCIIYMILLKGTIKEINFGHLIADMISNKNLHSVVTELFIRGRKLNIFVVFITQ